MPGPKAASKLQVSRQIPTPLNAELGGEDVLVLQYAYSLTHSAHASFLKQMALAYGQAISHHALRHAILAYAASRLPSEYFEQKFRDHQDQSIRSLRKRLDNPAG